MVILLPLVKNSFLESRDCLHIFVLVLELPSSCQYSVILVYQCLAMLCTFFAATQDQDALLALSWSHDIVCQRKEAQDVPSLSAGNFTFSIENAFWGRQRGADIGCPTKRSKMPVKPMIIHVLYTVLCNMTYDI